MERVLIIGSPGSGKSTLSHEVARRTGLPLHHLDRLYWKSGWVETEPAQWRETVERLVAEPRWIIDGNYSSSLAPRLARADTVIDLDLPAWQCVLGVLRRLVGAQARERPDMAVGCRERLNKEFIEFIVYTATFPRRVRPRIRQRMCGFTGRYICLRSRADAARFLAGLEVDE